MEKTYDYKVFSNGTFLGLLHNVKSEFAYSQEVNSAGATIQIKLGENIDTTTQPVEAILDETGDPLLDEAGDTIYEETATSLVDGTQSSFIRNGNTVEVTEYSSYNPNGLIIFNGTIKRVEANFGNENSEENIVITVYSAGSDLDNYVINDSA